MFCMRKGWYGSCLQVISFFIQSRTMPDTIVEDGDNINALLWSDYQLIIFLTIVMLGVMLILCSRIYQRLHPAA